MHVDSKWEPIFIHSEYSEHSLSYSETTKLISHSLGGWEVPGKAHAIVMFHEFVPWVIDGTFLLFS